MNDTSWLGLVHTVDYFIASPNDPYQISLLSDRCSFYLDLGYSFFFFLKNVEVPKQLFE